MPSQSSSPEAAIVGGGPAGLIAAEILARAGVAVTLYDRMPSAGRKLLMAGRGGLNLTHSEEFERFVARYAEARPQLEPLIGVFRPADLRAWSEGLGQETFVGSSGRVFPKAFKASPLLRAWLGRLDALGVRFALRHRWQGWDDAGHLIFTDAAGETVRAKPEATILALGGASWPRLGSDGGWVEPLSRRGIAVSTLRPTNMGFLCPWSEIMRSRFAGEPLKRIALTFAGITVKGEAIVTQDGIEGGAVYSLSARLRDAIEQDGSALLHIDLRPDLPHETLLRKLDTPRKGQSASTFLRKAAGLSPVGIALLREASPALPTDPEALARLIKAVPLTLTGTKSLERAISTAGGVPFSELDGHLMLRRMPGVFVAGEMLDWEAPTGGYLLQATFASGIAAARGVLAFLGIPDAALTLGPSSATRQT
ncbi:NAD(P)/FAD-dependent oxidoreductase [Microvirga terrestris]|uniref:TIGR03862 family flavoprotein n=1 Tax=Microvirga terrestris TaxID=2791024 RepID=A0ABS0HSN3_9HYPH|nr:TIGR03862 family flavoprotein [Microvirga terrestris]MBF9196306.1 TIGR03862 family flavoprotein [Microvirga terrestris]